MERVWHTVNDDNVCPVCRSLNGKPESVWKKRFPKGPPGCDNCRCSVGLRSAEPRTAKASGKSWLGKLLGG